jgi:hypothetical protein
MTFSLLPDCLASRFPAELVEMEEVVAKVQQAQSQEQAVADLWTDLGMAGALRKLRRWTRVVTTTLTLVRGLMPDLAPGEPTVTVFREQMDTPSVLVALREKVANHLHALPPPLGFGPRTGARPPRPTDVQHEAGPDPPS